MKALEIQNVQKVYASGLSALKGIDLSIELGSFFGLLGPNGAGKTTLIGIITSLVKKTQGRVLVLGHDIEEEPIVAKSLIGIVPQEFNFSLFDRVIDIVMNQAGYYGLGRALTKERAEFYLKALGLWDKQAMPARVLSGGMKRRLMIARALVHEPALLILDEPTAGVDVELRYSTWDFLRHLNQKGTTIILTSHYLEEIEALCDTVAMMNQGVMVHQGSLKTLLSSLKRETLVLEIRERLEKVPQLSGCEFTLLEPHLLQICFEKHRGLNAIIETLTQQGIQINSILNKTPRLEALFREFVAGHLHKIHSCIL